MISPTKEADDSLMRWRQGRRDPTKYDVLEVDKQYADWIIKITRQFRNDECFQMIKTTF